MKQILISIVCGLIIISCGAHRHTTTYNILFDIKENETFRIKDTIDLKGQTIELPQGVTLVSDGGLLYNGKVVGNKTKINGSKSLFSHITIKGTWDVQKVSTKLFDYLEYENALLDVFALTSPEVNNEVIITHGIYNVSIPSSRGAAITLNSHTTVRLDGDVVLKPNPFDICYVFLISDVERIKIYGDGSIIGDKPNHKGKTGEWGMGIHIVNSSNVSISGITIQDFWGDCIYIGKESSNIDVHNCKINNGRRQGISITSANNVRINNCEISNIAGTAPEYAIDIEPNRFQTVEGVIITGVHIMNCAGGILLYGDTRGARIKDVIINKCTIDGPVKKIPVSFSSAESVRLSNCEATTDEAIALYVHNVNDITLSYNLFSASGDVTQVIKSTIKSDKGNRLKRNKRN